MLLRAMVALTGGRLTGGLAGRVVGGLAPAGAAGVVQVGRHLLGAQQRGISTEEKDKIIQEINEKFVEAREEIEMAAESRETVYFNEEAEIAIEATNEVLSMYEDLCGQLDEKERGVLQRSMGMKMEQLRAELEVTIHEDDH